MKHLTSIPAMSFLLYSVASFSKLPPSSRLVGRVGLTTRSATNSHARNRAAGQFVFPYQIRAGKAALSSTATPEAPIANPLLEQSGLPKFKDIKDEHIEPAVEKLVHKLNEDFTVLESELANGAAPSSAEADTAYENVVEKMEKIRAPLEYAWGVVGHLNGVRNTDGLRDAYQKMQPKVVEATMKMGQSRPVLEAYQALQKILPDVSSSSSTTTTEEVEALSAVIDKTMGPRRIIDTAVKQMELSGVGLEGEAKEKFNAIKLELAELGTKFSNNVLDATKGYSILVTEASELEGLPDSALALMSQAARQAAAAAAPASSEGAETALAKQMAGSTPTAGPWLVTLDVPSYLPIMQHCRNRSMREKIYKAYLTRASGVATESPFPGLPSAKTGANTDAKTEEQGEGKTAKKLTDYDNTANIVRILNLRQEMAQMLGYQNYAEVSLGQKMAGKVEDVQKLTELLLERAYPAAEKEMEELLIYAQANGFEAKEEGGDQEDSFGGLKHWDIAYWSERQREALYEYKEEELRPYFPLPSVLTGMFQLAGDLFGVRIEEAKKGEVEVWHEDVMFFKVMDGQGGQQIASFYLDPYSRPENKRGGAWMDVCVGKSRALAKLPVAYLTCNGSPPVKGGEKEEDIPSLMTFREVETLFHEFGHGLQHMLTRVEHGDCAGINNVEWDAVELPSQFMENWCYHKPTVDKFARHYRTDEPLPTALFQKLVNQRTYQAGITMIRQLYFGTLDLTLHGTVPAPTDPQGSDLFAIQSRIAPKYSILQPLPIDRFLCGFGHIFAGGYAAGYYSYKWAEVMSADAFAAFEEAGLDDPEAVGKVGRRFRETVLGMGGGAPPAEVYRAFRGRDPTPEALLRHCGL